MSRVAVLCAVVAGLAGLVGLGGGALAAPSARQRVVLADPDPELRRAMEQVLAPWNLEVVIEGPPPADIGMARERADADTARFVVWRDGDELVVYDRELAFLERRDSRAGSLDSPTAAAAALTIKTMMRLPPPPAVEPVALPAPPAEAGIEVRLQAGVATRIARGTESDVSARFGGVAMLRPSTAWGLRLGVAADGGTSTAVSRASFKGAWRDWAIVGLVSWTFARDAWEIEPHAGGGARLSTLDGTEMNDPRSEGEMVACVRGGVWVRWRIARWTLGAALDVDESFGTPTYTKSDTPAEIFQVPGAGIELGAVISVDL